MAELPEIVRRQMARQAGGEHPDPDLLTAFAEGTLTARERGEVLAHLGACAACREVVSLAMPETPALQPAPRAVPAGWLRWPVLRWGAVAAAVVVVAAAVMMRETQRASIDGERALSLPKQEETAPAAVVPPALDEKKTRSQAKDNAAAKPKTGAKKDARADAAAVPSLHRNEAAGAAVTKELPTTEARDSVHGSALGALQQQREQVAEQQRSYVTAQQQAVRQQTVVDQQSPPAGTAAGNIQQQNELMSMPKQDAPTARRAEVPPAPPRRVQENVQQNIVAAGRAETAPAAAVGGPVEASRAKSTVMMKAVRLSPARWRISSQGELERSLDAGANWHIVPVQKGAAFRAVSALDTEIWAGGAAGALFHSTDGGQNWTRVVPRAGEMVLRADIARVDFTDPLRGVVATVSAETWATADGGRTWTVRRP